MVADPAYRRAYLQSCTVHTCPCRACKEVRHMAFVRMNEAMEAATDAQFAASADRQSAELWVLEREAAARYLEAKAEYVRVTMG
jgi:hypothetical protein